jgi:hypothetical protein
MNRIFLLCAILLFSTALPAQSHTFSVAGDHFTLDGKSFKALSGELHCRIGRFWNIGPQQTLYVPGPWPRKGTNEIIVFALSPTSPQPHVAGLNQPILNGPVADKTTSKQE